MELKEKTPHTILNEIIEAAKKLRTGYASGGQGKFWH